MVDSHRVWAIVGVSLAVVLLGVLFYAFSSNQEAVAGKAIAGDVAVSDLLLENALELTSDGERIYKAEFDAIGVNGLRNHYVIYSLLDSGDDYVCICESLMCPTFDECSARRVSTLTLGTES